MQDQLPVRVDPYRLAEKGLTLSGKLEISKLPRLKALTAGSSGDMECQLTFSKKARQYFLTGHLKGCLKLTCQRCLEPYDQEIDSHFSVRLVADDQEAGRALEYTEPLTVVDDELDISVVVEDEVLLSMPAIPRHASQRDCKPPAVTKNREDVSEQLVNPFAVLEQLKKH